MNNDILDLKGVKILIVDDMPANIDVLRKTLGPEDYEIFFATSGEAAIKTAHRCLPDLIILDILMPGLNGFETCQKLKKDPLTRDIPIMFISAKNETKDIVDGFIHGGVDYITKPFQPEEVCARVKTHLHLQMLKCELKSKNRRLEELNDLKNKFIGMASHDMLNPLNSIIGFSEMLLEGRDELSKEEQDEYLIFINSVSKNMSNLVNDVLNVSVIESGKLELNLTAGSLKSLVKERVFVHKPIAAKKNIALHAKLVDLPECWFDANRISQVLDSLISNAIKFSLPNCGVLITLEKETNMCKVSIRDEGPGISPKDQSKLFQHFKKLSAKPTAGEGSIGLGLAIAKKMVEAHKGTLVVESLLGEGCTFTLKIPLQGPHK